MNEVLILLSSYPHLGLKFWGGNHVDKLCCFKKKKKKKPPTAWPPALTPPVEVSKV